MCLQSECYKHGSWDMILGNTGGTDLAHAHTLCHVHLYTQYRDSIRRFCDQELAPHADKIDRDNGFDQFREFWRKLGDMGLLGITAPGK